MSLGGVLEGERGRRGGGGGVPCEIDACAARGDAPACPEGFAFVEGGARADVLAGQGADCGGDAVGRGFGGAGDGYGAGGVEAVFGLDGVELHVSCLPPVQLGHVLHAALLKPHSVAQGREVVRFGELLLQTLDGRVAQMVVVVVAYHHDIDRRQVFEFAWRGRVALQALDVDRRAAVFKHRVEEHAQPAGELDVVASVAEPCGAELGSFACGEERGGADGDGGRCGVGFVGLACDFAAGKRLAAGFDDSMESLTRTYPTKSGRG